MARKAGASSFSVVREPVGDRGVVGGGARIGLGGEALAQIERGRAVVRLQFVEQRGVIGRLDDHRDIVMVLGGGADHRRSADIDILDAVVVGRALRDRRLERIEIDHQQIDGADAVRLHRAGMLLVVADREQAAMHLRMQRLDAAVHHFGKAGQLGHVDDLHARRRPAPCACRRSRRSRRRGLPARGRNRSARPCPIPREARATRGGDLRS